MPAAGSPGKRKSRYTPCPEFACRVTPHALATLQHLALLELVTADMLAPLCGRSEQAIRRDLRILLDNALVRVVIMPRAMLIADGEAPLRAAFGSAKNIFQLTAKGLRLLRSMGLSSPDILPTAYGPQNGMFVRHELGTRQAVVYFLRCASLHGHAVEHLYLGERAAVDLHRTQLPKSARPDAWFMYRFGERVLAACLEYDTGSEKGTRRWDDKLAAYRLLLEPARFQAVTGQTYGRVIVICRTSNRRDHLTRLIRERAQTALAERFWVAAVPDLDVPDLSRAVWRRPGTDGPIPLISPEYYSDTAP